MNIVVVTPAGSEQIVRPLIEALRSERAVVGAHAGDIADIAASKVWRDAEILVGAGFKCRTAEIEAAPQLKAIVTLTIGYNGVDVSAASARRILLVNGQAPENYESMAEATIMLLLALLYDLAAAQDRLRTASWHATGVRAQMLKGKTVGIIGFGNIARNIVSRLENWGVRLLVHTRNPPQSGLGSVEFVTLDELLAHSDVVVPLASLNASSVHLLDAGRLAMMKPGAFVVNTARGGLIDEDALPRLVEAGSISGVALDVFETEPLPLDSPLMHLPGAILTPHDIGHTRESTGGMMRLGLQNVAAVARGEIPASAINADAIPGWPTSHVANDS